MSQLLLELLSEEIPARMQARAGEDLARLLGDRLKEAGFAFEKITPYVGPRRLAVVVDGLPARSQDVSEERKGPRVGAPEKALEGFMRGAGLSSIEEAQTREDKKGAYYVAVIERPGRDVQDVLAEIVPDIVRKFPWPKSMRWGDGHLRWVRPLQRILCLYDGAVVNFEIDGVESGNVTEGHRMMGRGPFLVSSFHAYRNTLQSEGHVLLDREERKRVIAEDAAKVCKEAGLELVEDHGLLEEVAGLAEWPVVLLGEMDPAFLDLPPEVIRLSMRTHQKYFAVRDPKTGALAPNFVVVANQLADDGGKAIAAGNARVLSARLNDARFFWDEDLKRGLAEMGEGLSDIVFHQKLGTVADKVGRVAALARELAPKVGADPDAAERAARLAKNDLTSEMVGEFPELQGVMGRYYALELGEDAAIADAVRDHYKPQGPADAVPSEPVAVAVALADKLDTLVGFWAIDEKPTGSGDPYALRRAALGVIRMLLRFDIRLQLTAIETAEIWDRILSQIIGLAKAKYSEQFRQVALHAERAQGVFSSDDILKEWAGSIKAKRRDLLAFFADRLKVHLRDEGHRHDLVDAVFALGEDDLVLIVKRVEALGRFLDSEDGKNLLAGYTRATNILRIEEKKDGKSYAGKPDGRRLKEAEEKDLNAALNEARKKVDAAVKREDFEAAMAALAPLRPAVDAFFDRVTVNVDGDDALRQNRLMLLSQFRDALSAVADFSKIEG